MYISLYHKNKRTNKLVLLITFLCALLLTNSINAKVTRIQVSSIDTITSSTNLIHSGPYEIIKGIIFFEVDPDNSANSLIVDLKKAIPNRNGMVEFSTEFELHKPVDPDRGNHRLIYFVNNRGYKMGDGFFNFNADGNWLYEQGYSFLWCGWNCDVPESENRFNINVPIAYEDGEIITGRFYSEIISYSNNLVYSMPIVWGGSLAYPPLNMDKSDAKLTRRKYRADEPIEITNEDWAFGKFKAGKVIEDSNSIYIKQGFLPGWLYDLEYIAKNPKVTGLGLAAIRDVVSFFRYESSDSYGNCSLLSNSIEYCFAWGHSQSARLLNHFVYQNFNGDESGRKVFDGMILNCPGSGKGLFNSRFAQFTRHGSQLEDNLYPTDFFPFASVKQTDPLTGKSADSFELTKSTGFMPKMMYVNSSTDYWTRAASLLHTDVEGKKDLDIDGNVRIYLISGSAHTESRLGIIERALLKSLDQWVSFNIASPPSQIPKISDGTLVTYEEFKQRFPKIPDLTLPNSLYQPLRLDMGQRWESEGIATNVPPKFGEPYVCLVPQVDKDGNESAGIHLPEVELPLATFVGWFMRDSSFSISLRRNSGKVIPLQTSYEERKILNDPRESIIERFPTKSDYIFEWVKSLMYLNSRRFLLDEDFDNLIKEAAELNYWIDNKDELRINVKEVKADPEIAVAAKPLLISIEFGENCKDVLFVKSDFHEGQNYSITLNDDGINGDKRAGDNIWSYQITLPPNVPSGEFHFDFKCFDRNFNLRTIPDELASVKFVIK